MPDEISLEEYWELIKKDSNKFGAKLVEIDGYTFQSGVEGKRYEQLRLTAQAGQIQDLKVHAPAIEILPAFRDRYGKRHKATFYIPDFSYYELGQFVIEDVKGGEATQTALFKLKYKMVLLRYPEIDFHIIVM
jgi:hypothetical protein